jgi:acyl-coenzyme A thioesterase PaaI-like protein
VKPGLLRFLVNLYPPYIGAGVRIASIEPDWSEMVVELKLRFYNRNYVGTHYGGNLFTMTDPFHMLMLIHRLGPEYKVWDQRAEITYLKPGRGRVRATMGVTEAQLQQIREATDNGAKHLPRFLVEIIDEQGDVVATVDKTLYVRRKPD